MTLPRFSLVSLCWPDRKLHRLLPGPPLPPTCTSTVRLTIIWIQIVMTFLNRQPDDLAALLEALAAVFEVDADLWLDETARYPILGQVQLPQPRFLVDGTVKEQTKLFMQLRKLRDVLVLALSGCRLLLISCLCIAVEGLECAAM